MRSIVLRPFLLALAALAFAAPSASADCGLDVINEYFSAGAVQGYHPQSCYDSALAQLDPDAREYSGAESAIAAAKARDAAVDNDAGTKGTPGEGGSADDGGDGATDDGSTGGGSTSGGGAGGAEVDPPAGGDSSAPTGDSQPGVGGEGDLPETAAAGLPAEVESGSSDGVVKSAIRDAGPARADEVPTPVIVLGGLAVALVAVGAGGLVARRYQGRRG